MRKFTFLMSLVDEMVRDAVRAADLGWGSFGQVGAALGRFARHMPGPHDAVNPGDELTLSTFWAAYQRATPQVRPDAAGCRAGVLAGLRALNARGLVPSSAKVYK